MGACAVNVKCRTSWQIPACGSILSTLKTGQPWWPAGVDELRVVGRLLVLLGIEAHQQDPLAQARQLKPSLVIIDLNSAKADPVETIAAGTPVIASSRAM